MNLWVKLNMMYTAVRDPPTVILLRKLAKRSKCIMMAYQAEQRQSFTVFKKVKINEKRNEK